MLSVRSLNHPGKIYMIQDNSSIHNSNIVQDWIKSRNGIIVWNWPPLSPDLSPIDNLQAHMVAKWNPNNIQTKDTLLEYIYNEWDKLKGSPEVFENLATS